MPTVAFVVAHPDDDAYGAAGSVALHAGDPDFRFVLVHATSGEAGDLREGFPATRETLGAVRRAECAAAWRAVGRGCRTGTSGLASPTAVWRTCRSTTWWTPSPPSWPRSHPTWSARSARTASSATPTTWERRVSREWHVIAWPPHPGPPHTDIFEALP